MTAEGLGISFNRESYAGNMKYRKKVNYYTMGESPRKTAFVAGYRQGMFVPEYMQRFIELISEQGRNIYFPNTNNKNYKLYKYLQSPIY